MFKPDIGTVISLDTGAVITGYTVTIEVKKPNGTTASWTATIGVDTKSVEHAIASGDLTESGTYQLQAKVSSGGNTWYGSTASLVVKDMFK
jgi:hypothetical protein